jgi:hypothetical protein
MKTFIYLALLPLIMCVTALVLARLSTKGRSG